MQAQLQVQPSIHCSGRLYIPGRRRQEEEETHQVVPPTMEVAAPVNGVLKADLRQEEALDQEEQDHLHQEAGQEEEACSREHHSNQEEEQVIQALPHRHLQASHNLYAHQIHGAHLIDLGKPYRSSCYRPTTRHATYWR